MVVILIGTKESLTFRKMDFGMSLASVLARHGTPYPKTRFENNRPPYLPRLQAGFLTRISSIDRGWSETGIDPGIGGHR